MADDSAFDPDDTGTPPPLGVRLRALVARWRKNKRPTGWRAGLGVAADELEALLDDEKP